jgi:hypothetical protein
MTTKTTTTRRASKASERPPTALIDALQGASTATPPTPPNAHHAKTRHGVRCLRIVKRPGCCLPALSCLTTNAL